MAWTFVSTVNGTGNKTAGTAATATVTASVGDQLIVACGCDDVTGVDAIGTGAVTDSQSNTYTRIGTNQGQTNATNTCVAVFVATLATALSSETVTFTPNASSAAKDLTVYKFTGGTATERGAEGTANGTGTAVSVTTAEPLDTDIVFALTVIEQSTGAGAITDDTDTTNGTWSTGVGDGTSGGSGGSNVRLHSQYKIVTATGSQTWDVTIPTADWRALAVGIQAGSSDVQAPAGTSTPTATANNSATALGAPGGTSVATATANDATVQTGAQADAGTTTATATASNIGSVVATGTPTTASATATAQNSQASVGPTPTTATVTVTANDATVSLGNDVLAPAGLAAVTATAQNPQTAASAPAGAASAAGAANAATAAQSSLPAAAASSLAASNAQAVLVAAAQVIALAVAAYDATVSTSGDTQAMPTAAVCTAVAYDATTVSSSPGTPASRVHTVVGSNRA